MGEQLGCLALSFLWGAGTNALSLLPEKGERMLGRGGVLAGYILFFLLVSAGLFFLGMGPGGGRLGLWNAVSFLLGWLLLPFLARHRKIQGEKQKKR